MTIAVATEDEVLAEIVRRIVETADPDKVILFGSRARGEGGPHSDYDILVVKDSDQPQYRRTVPLYVALRDVWTPVDVVWWTQAEIDDWSEVKTFFITTVVREGRVVYQRLPEEAGLLIDDAEEEHEAPESPALQAELAAARSGEEETVPIEEVAGKLGVEVG